jgi:hypothetical protein
MVLQRFGDGGGVVSEEGGRLEVGLVGVGGMGWWGFDGGRGWVEVYIGRGDGGGTVVVAGGGCSRLWDAAVLLQGGLWVSCGYFWIGFGGCGSVGYF